MDNEGSIKATPLGNNKSAEFTVGSGEDTYKVVAKRGDHNSIEFVFSSEDKANELYNMISKPSDYVKSTDPNRELWIYLNSSLGSLGKLYGVEEEVKSDEHKYSIKTIANRGNEAYNEYVVKTLEELELVPKGTTLLFQ